MATTATTIAARDLQPLPRAERRDRRTAAERTPQVPVTVWYRVGDDERSADVKVGRGGWFDDYRNALARLIGDDTAAKAVIVAVEPTR